VTGNLTATSLVGDGMGLSNVTPADSSITNTKLAEDAASLSKITGERIFLSGDNVGIGTKNPEARLEVAGNAKFNGPLNVQGTLSASSLNVGGVAVVEGNLSVTGTLSAASFAGDGAGLSNVAPADNSVSSAKLALDAASLSKVSGGTMIINGGKVGIGTTHPLRMLRLVRASTRFLASNQLMAPRTRATSASAITRVGGSTSGVTEKRAEVH
jgi:hypothetical protein